MRHLHPGRVVEVPERQLIRTSVLVLVLLHTWSCLVVVVLPCRTVCHPQKIDKITQNKKNEKFKKKRKEKKSKTKSKKKTLFW